MGVPAFYRWLSEKYPKIVVDMLEDRSVRVAGTEIPLDLTAENPNGIEFDNLYIDMNGIIHPCSHPEDKPPPETEEDMYKNIMEYVDRLFSAVRPRRLLYLAIDGVAPRAKMNQQRSRRFRSAQEAEEAADLREEIRQSMKEMGMKVPPKSKPSWDSNIITPGTVFMHKLSVYLRFYVQDRVNRDKAWQNIKVILSDASEPGEGEHKIMDFVRRQRNQPGYDPNQHHILHGLDADLIMLGLATHERSFTILREQVLFGRKQREASERKAAVLEQQRVALTGQDGKEKRGEHGEHDGDILPHKPLQMLQLWVLREYLENEFRELQAPGRVPFGYDFERVVDDFVFLCFFVGNDFLPHLPSLDIRDGAIDYLFNVYKRVISSLGDYLTASGGVVNLKQVDVIMAEVGEIEDEVFRRRKVAETKDQARRGGGMGSSHGGRGAGRPGGAPGAFPNGRDAGGRGGGGRGGRGGGTYPASASERRQASKQTRQTMRDSDDAIKTGAVPVRSVKTDRLKDAKRKLEDGGERGTSWGGRRAEAGEGEGEHANKSAAAKLREKLGGKKVAKTSTTGDGAQQPPLKVPRVEGGDESGSCKGKRGGRGDEAGLENGVGVENQEDEDGDETDNEDEEEEDEGERGMTPEEINSAKSFLKDKVKDQVQVLLDEARNSVEDKVRLWESGWKDRYYTDKCKVEDIEGGGGREKLFQTYVEGLCWVMLYYYQGCPSWTWYFPFHYAPFASDLINCDRFEMEFEESRPFRPIEQLMGVLPAASCQALPKPCRPLMTDPDSPIIDFYPKIVPCDPNGKPMPWLWVVLLPFIDEKRLLSNLQPLYKKFTPEEVERNSFGPSYLFVNVRTPVGKALQTFLSGGGAEVDGLSLEGQQGMGADQMALRSEAWGGFGGKVALPRAGVSTPVGTTLVAPQQPQGAFDDLENNQVAMTVYSMPPKGAHVCRMLSGVQMLARTLTAQDLASRRPPRLNRNMSIAEMGSSKYSQAQQGGYRSGVHGGGSSGPGHRMIRHQLGASSGGYHGQHYSHSQGGHSSYGAMGYQTPGYVPGGSGSGGGGGGYATKGYEDRHHMHQPTGNRRWGSQEPTPKRPGRGRSNQHQHRHQQQQHEAYRQPPPPQQQAFYSHAASQPVGQQSSVAFGRPQPVYYQQPLQAAPTQLPSGFYGTVQQQVLAQAPQASHSFQHPGYAPQPTQPPQAPAGPGGFPTMDSLRSKLANALLQSKVPGTAPTAPPGATQGSHYAYSPQGTPSPQQYFATAPAPAAPQPHAAAAPVYPYQHIRFDSNGNPTWGGQPWSSTGGAPPR